MPARATATACACATPPAPSTSSRAPLQHDETFDLVLDLREQPGLQPAPAAAGLLSRRRATSAALADAVLKLRELVGEFDKPRFFRYQHKLCAHSRNETDRLHGLHRRLLAPAPSAATPRARARPRAAPPAASSSSRTCAWAAAPAPRCARAAPDLRLPRHGRPGPAPAHDAHRLRPRRRPRRGAADPQRSRRHAPARRTRPRRAQPATAACTACRRACCRWRCGTPPASASTSGWPPSPRAPARSGCCSPTKRRPSTARRCRADGGGAGHPHRPGLCAASTCGCSTRATRATWQRWTPRCARRRRRRWPAPATFVGAGRQARHAGTGHRPPAGAGAAGRPTKSPCPPPARPSAPCWSTPTKCTLCLSCVSACPEGALADNPDKPQLRFIEKNCVQCGLCATHLPRRRHHPAAAPVAGRRRQGAQEPARAGRDASPTAASSAASPSARCAPSRTCSPSWPATPPSRAPRPSG